jgi:hypothetical protein
MFQLARMEVEELPRSLSNAIPSHKVQQRTLTVPSRVLAMTRRFKASDASPVMHLSPPFFEPELRETVAISGGGSPTLKALRLIPDCMFHMHISPVEEPAIPKLPQDVTHTACPAKLWSDSY